MMVSSYFLVAVMLQEIAARFPALFLTLGAWSTIWRLSRPMLEALLLHYNAAAFHGWGSLGSEAADPDPIRC